MILTFLVRAGVFCHILYCLSGLITSVGEERATFSAIDYYFGMKAQIGKSHKMF